MLLLLGLGPIVRLLVALTPPPHLTPPTICILHPCSCPDVGIIMVPLCATPMHSDHGNILLALVLSAFTFKLNALSPPLPPGGDHRRDAYPDHCNGAAESAVPVS